MGFILQILFFHLKITNSIKYYLNHFRRLFIYLVHENQLYLNLFNYCLKVIVLLILLIWL